MDIIQLYHMGCLFIVQLCHIASTGQGYIHMGYVGGNRGASACDTHWVSARVCVCQMALCYV